MEEKGKGRSKKGEKMRGGEQRHQEGTGLYDFFPVGESCPYWFIVNYGNNTPRFIVNPQVRQGQVVLEED